MLGPGTTALLALALFGFWLVLSGHLDAFHVVLGALSSVWIALGTRRLLGLDPPIVKGALGIAEALRLLRYLPWLVWQIVIASLQVARVVLDPALPIAPRVLRVRVPLPHNFARLVLANSITLTPGTVTLDVEGDDYLVHALTPASAMGLGTSATPGPIIRRVTAIFSAEHVEG